MKKVRKRLAALAIIFTVSIVSLTATGCQSAAKHLGGNFTLKLEPNQKLVTITWKDDSLWYLTRPMKDGEEAETYTFQESKDLGVMEGTVTVVETKGEE